MIYLTRCNLVCILYLYFGINPMQTNNESTLDLHWNLYRKFLKLRDQTVIEMVKVPAVSDTYQQLKGKREVYDETASYHLEMWTKTC